jgi:hypothetical protein
MKKIRPTLWALTALVLGIIGFLAVHSGKKENNQQQVQFQASHDAKKLPAPAVTESDNYQLIVGANPSVGKETKFLPPANSVVVTNEAQLRLLIEQTRPKQTPTASN